MKLTFKEFMSATGVPERTLRRMIASGDLKPAQHNPKGKPSYFDDQNVADAKALYAAIKGNKNSATKADNEPPAESMSEPTTDDKPVEENHGVAQIDATAAVEAVVDQTPADREHDATNEDSKPADDQHKETPATVTELIIDNEFRNLIPPLADNERAQLEENILRDGIQDSLKTWRGILIDGHNRYSIAQAYGLPFNVVEMEFTDRDAVKRWIIENQFGRRNINRYSRGELALKLEASIADRAKENLSTHTADGYQRLANLPKGESIDTRSELAKIAGVSPRTMATIKYLVDNASEEIKTALRNDAFTINAAYEAVKAGATTVDDVTEFKTRKEKPAPKPQETEQPAQSTVEASPDVSPKETSTSEDSDAGKIVVGNKPLDSIVGFVAIDDDSERDDATVKNQPHELDTTPVTNEPPKVDSEPHAQIVNEPHKTTAEENFMRVFDDMSRHFSPELFVAIHKAIDSSTVDDLPALKQLHDALNSVAQTMAEIVILIEVKIGEMLNELDEEKLPATTDAGGKDIEQ